VEREGTLPLRGSLPDMASSTSAYQDLQRLYVLSKMNISIASLGLSVSLSIAYFA
jgi:hypothetical protein